MKHTKRLAIVTLLLAFAFCIAVPCTARAADKIKTIQLNKETTFTVKGDTKPTYQFKTPKTSKTGYFYIEMRINGIAVNPTTGETARVDRQEKYSKGYITITNNKKKIIQDGRGSFYTDKKSRTPYIAMQAGKTYTINMLLYSGILENENPWDKYTDYHSRNYNYKITFKIVTKYPKHFEVENNNSEKKANKLKVNTVYSGLISARDTDHYVFTAPKAGNYCFYQKGLTQGMASIGLIRDSDYLYPEDILYYVDPYRKGSTPKWKKLKIYKLRKNERVAIEVYENYSSIYQLKVKKV